jgi:hypothetical protein
VFSSSDSSAFPDTAYHVILLLTGNGFHDLLWSTPNGEEISRRRGIRCSPALLPIFQRGERNAVRRGEPMLRHVQSFADRLRVRKFNRRYALPRTLPPFASLPFAGGCSTPVGSSTVEMISLVRGPCLDDSTEVSRSGIHWLARVREDVAFSVLSYTNRKLPACAEGRNGSAIIRKSLILTAAY